MAARQCKGANRTTKPLAARHGLFRLTPQVRGTGISPKRRLYIGRFIPAGAGNSGKGRAVVSKWPVYPRRCGEQTTPQMLQPPSIGLSPQVRGTGTRTGFNYDTRRFIPAGAGNRRPAWRMTPPAPVYPRRCGEQVLTRGGGFHKSGLSPQVRGTGGRGSDRWRSCRFIPAGAGNRARLAPRRTESPVYPRRCGEQRVSSTNWPSSPGLSPQVRGTDLRDELLVENARFIPAGAGNRAQEEN